MVAALTAVAGCAHHALPGDLLPGAVGPPLAGQAEVLWPANPVFVPAGDREYVWNQLVDTVDDYFKIEREQRVRLVGGVLTEGRIDTYPVVGATLLEPWRRDSTPGYQKLHATLQSIRRRATVRVMPVADGYSVEVAVYRELEDVDRPEHATVGSATLRHDGSLVRMESPLEEGPSTLGWIPLGRDGELEQQILAEIQSRLLDQPAPLDRLPPVGG